MTRAPWYHWPVALAALIWHAAGAADYTLTQLRVAAYLVQFTPEQIAYFQAMPAWVDAAWAVGVWGGLLGAVLLVMRSGMAVLCLAASCVALAAATLWLLALADPPMAAVTGMTGVWVILGAVVVSLVFYLYARTLRVGGRLG